MITICSFSRFQLLDCRWQWMTLIHMKTRGELATAHTSAHPKRRKKKKVKPRQDLRILPILDVTVLPLSITNEHCTEFIRVVDAAETEIYSTSLDICQYRKIPGRFLATHLARNVVVCDLLDLTVAAGGNLVKLVHRDLQVNTHSADNTSSTNGATQG